MSGSFLGVFSFVGHPVSIVDTLTHNSNTELKSLFNLSFTCKYIVSEQFGHPVLKFSSNLELDTSIISKSWLITNVTLPG